jgi:hypothetical protein
MRKISLFKACFAFLAFQYIVSGAAEAGMQRKLEVTLAKAKKRAEDVLINMDKNISAASKKLTGLDLKSDEARNVLIRLSGTNKHAIDCAIVDMEGKLAVVEPEEFRKFEGTDIRAQEQVAQVLKEKRPVLSKLFMSVEGVAAADFEYPVMNAAGEMKGSLSMMVKPGEILSDLFAGITRQSGYSICVTQTDGTLLYDTDKAQIGKNVFTDEAYKLFPSLVSLFRQVAEKEKGAGTYEFYANGLKDKRVIKKVAVWGSVSMYGTNWRIVVFAEEWIVAGDAE